MGAAAGVPARRSAAGWPVAEPPDGDQRDLLSDPDRVRPWRDLPEGFGNWKTIYNRHRRWSADGTWQEILDRLRAGCDEAEGKDWTLSADSTVVRAHQHTAGARRALPATWSRGAAANDKNGGRAPGPAPRWATRRTPPRPTAPTCASAGSRRSSR